VQREQQGTEESQPEWRQRATLRCAECDAALLFFFEHHLE